LKSGPGTAKITQTIKQPTRHVVELAKIDVVFVGFPDDLQRCSPEVCDMFSFKTAPYQNNSILVQIHQGKEIDESMA